MGMCLMLNMCTDLSSDSLESRNVVLLVSRGRRGLTCELRQSQAHAGAQQRNFRESKASVFIYRAASSRGAAPTSS